MQQSLPNQRHKLNAIVCIKLCNQGFFHSLFLVTYFLLINNCCLAWSSDSSQKLFRAFSGHKQSTAQGLQLLAQDRYRFDIELGSHDPTLSNAESGHFLLIESWVKAVYGQNLRRFLGCTHSPVEDWIVMYAQIIAKPHYNSVHLT